MFTLLLANEHKENNHLTYDQSLSLLQAIHNDAIIFGSGKKHIYVFVDPLCPHSRKFITMVSENPKMLSKYKYYIFLYGIKRMKSSDVISAVYISKNPIETLLQIMVEEKVEYHKGDEIIKRKVNRIATVAQKMNVYKRPYIFIIK